MAELTDNIEKCSNHIKLGGLVSFPTETVYGIGANIYDLDALISIFKIKQRPTNNPLIVHIHSFEQIRKLVNISDNDIKIVKLITDKFWPGPLTILLPKSDLVNNIISANTSYVGIRMPASDLSLELLRKCNLPIAAPSANKYCHVSPTHYSHVYQEFRNEPIKILKEKDSKLNIGIESTIIKINFSEKKIIFLRPGFITKNMIQAACNSKDFNFTFENQIEKELVPGSNFKHYSINKETYLLEINCDIMIDEKTTFLDFGSSYKEKFLKNYYTMSEKGDLLEAMQNIYSLLWKIEKNDTKMLIIYLPKLENQFYNALYNRIIKCCSGNNLLKDFNKDLKINYN